MGGSGGRKKRQVTLSPNWKRYTLKRNSPETRLPTMGPANISVCGDRGYNLSLSPCVSGDLGTERSLDRRGCA